MANSLIYSRDITFRRIMAFVAPTMLMTIIQSSYMMIDGMFISNLLGNKALSSLTLISPYFSFFMAIAAMFASGGSAVVMKKMGEGSEREARGDFTTLALISTLTGVAFTAVFLIFTEPLVRIFKTTPDVAELCRQYLFAYSFFIVPQVLFSVFEIYTIASDKSVLAMCSSIAGGVTNIILDYVMIKIWDMGMAGAAIASGLGMVIPCVILGAGFFRKNRMLHFSALRFDLKVLTKTITNGASEFASNLIGGVVIMLFNARMMILAGEDGVAASAITYYVFGLMSALYMGFMYGVSPLLSFFFGSGETDKMKKIRKISLLFIGVVSAASTVFAIAGSELLVSAFTRPGSAEYALAVSGNRLFSIALLLVGFNTFSSMLFTALSNGRISAIIAFCRTFVFLVAAILALPLLWGVNGLWLSVPASEALALALSVYFLIKYQKQYQY